MGGSASGSGYAPSSSGGQQSPGVTSAYTPVNGLNAQNSQFANSMGYNSDNNFAGTGFGDLSSDAQNAIYDWGRTGNDSLVTGNKDVAGWFGNLDQAQQQGIVGGQGQWQNQWEANEAQRAKDAQAQQWGGGKGGGQGGSGGGKGGMMQQAQGAGYQGMNPAATPSVPKPNEGQYGGLPNANEGPMSDAANPDNPYGPYTPPNPNVPSIPMPEQGGGAEGPYSGTTPVPPKPTAPTAPVQAPLPPPVQAPVAPPAPVEEKPSYDPFGRWTKRGDGASELDERGTSGYNYELFGGDGLGGYGWDNRTRRGDNGKFNYIDYTFSG